MPVAQPDVISLVSVSMILAGHGEKALAARSVHHHGRIKQCNKVMKPVNSLSTQSYLDLPHALPPISSNHSPPPPTQPRLQ
jgi:hypothetical protein